MQVSWGHCSVLSLSSLQDEDNKSRHYMEYCWSQWQRNKVMPLKVLPEQHLSANISLVKTDHMDTLVPNWKGIYSSAVGYMKVKMLELFGKVIVTFINLKSFVFIKFYGYFKSSLYIIYEILKLAYLIWKYF